MCLCLWPGRSGDAKRMRLVLVLGQAPRSSPADLHGERYRLIADNLRTRGTGFLCPQFVDKSVRTYKGSQRHDTRRRKRPSQKFVTWGHQSTKLGLHLCIFPFCFILVQVTILGMVCLHQFLCVLHIISVPPSPQIFPLPSFISFHLHPAARSQRQTSISEL